MFTISLCHTGYSGNIDIDSLNVAVFCLEGSYSEYEANKRLRLGEEATQPKRIKYRKLMEKCPSLATHDSHTGDIRDDRCYYDIH